LPKPEPEFTGGISFLKRDFLKFGVLFVVGIGSEIALYRCMPGVKIFEDEEVPPWKLVEQGRLSRSDDHAGGDCTMVKFCGYVLTLLACRGLTVFHSATHFTQPLNPQSVTTNMFCINGPYQKAVLGMSLSRSLTPVWPSIVVVILVF